MSNSHEDIWSNFFLKLIQWQIMFVIKTGVFMWKLPFRLLKRLKGNSNGGAPNNERNA